VGSTSSSACTVADTTSTADPNAAIPDDGDDGDDPDPTDDASGEVANDPPGPDDVDSSYGGDVGHDGDDAAETTADTTAETTAETTSTSSTTKTSGFCNGNTGGTVTSGTCLSTWTSFADSCTVDQHGCPSEACDDPSVYEPWCCTTLDGGDCNDWCYCGDSGIGSTTGGDSPAISPGGDSPDDSPGDSPGDSYVQTLVQTLTIAGIQSSDLSSASKKKNIETNIAVTLGIDASRVTVITIKDVAQRRRRVLRSTNVVEIVYKVTLSSTLIDHVAIKAKAKTISESGSPAHNIVLEAVAVEAGVEKTSITMTAKPMISETKKNDGSSCSSSTECSSGTCGGSNCCGANGKLLGCTDCNSHGGCSKCGEGFYGEESVGENRIRSEIDTLCYECPSGMTSPSGSMSSSDCVKDSSSFDSSNSGSSDSSNLIVYPCDVEDDCVTHCKKAKVSNTLKDCSDALEDNFQQLCEPKNKYCNDKTDDCDYNCEYDMCLPLEEPCEGYPDDDFSFFVCEPGKTKSDRGTCVSTLMTRDFLSGALSKNNGCILFTLSVLLATIGLI